MQVSLPSFSLGLPAYYILALSESSSNLSRYDGVRYGNQVFADELNSLYGDSRAEGLGSEVNILWTFVRKLFLFPLLVVWISNVVGLVSLVAY